MQRHLRASSFAAAPESCAMKGSLVRFLPRHSNSGCRVCHLAEAAHGIQGVDAKSIVVVRFRRILLVAVRSAEGPLTEHITATQAQPQERVFMPRSGRWPPPCGWAGGAVCTS